MDGRTNDLDNLSKVMHDDTRGWTVFEVCEGENINGHLKTDRKISQTERTQKAHSKTKFLKVLDQYHLYQVTNKIKKQ